MKMWVATIIPKDAVKAATKSRKERGLTEYHMLHRVAGQMVKSSNELAVLEQWIAENATDEDQVSIHRWRPKGMG